VLEVNYLEVVKIIDIKPRKPTEQELFELQEYLKTDNDLRYYYYAVFDNYSCDTPGYRGKLMVAVYGFPEFYEVYIWIDGKIQRVEQDKGFNQ
jgi:hypothetical protein